MGLGTGSLWCLASSRPPGEPAGAWALATPTGSCRTPPSLALSLTGKASTVLPGFWAEGTSSSAKEVLWSAKETPRKKTGGSVVGCLPAVASSRGCSLADRVGTWDWVSGVLLLQGPPESRPAPTGQIRRQPVATEQTTVGFLGRDGADSAFLGFPANRESLEGSSRLLGRGKRFECKGITSERKGDPKKKGRRARPDHLCRLWSLFVVGHTVLHSQ